MPRVLRRRGRGLIKMHLEHAHGSGYHRSESPHKNDTNLERLRQSLSSIELGPKHHSNKYVKI